MPEKKDYRIRQDLINEYALDQKAQREKEQKELSLFAMPLHYLCIRCGEYTHSDNSCPCDKVRKDDETRRGN